MLEVTKVSTVRGNKTQISSEENQVLYFEDLNTWFSAYGSQLDAFG